MKLLITSNQFKSYTTYAGSQFNLLADTQFKKIKDKTKQEVNGDDRDMHKDTHLQARSSDDEASVTFSTL